MYKSKRDRSDTKKVFVGTTTYFKNGGVASTVMKRKGQPHGLCTTYYESGRIKETCNYVAGRLHGEYMLFFDDENSTPSEKGSYQYNKQHGEFTCWNNDGSVRITGVHSN